MGCVQSPLLNVADQPRPKKAAGMGTSKFVCQCVSAANGLLKRKRNSLAVGKTYVEGRRAYKASCVVIELDEFVSSNNRQVMQWFRSANYSGVPG